MPSISKSRLLFPITLGLVILSASVCVASIVHGVSPKQVPVLLIFIASVNLSALTMIYTIVSRVRRLRNDVTKIASGADLSQRLRAEGNDELFDLANNINVMLAALEEAQEYLVIAREAAESADRSKAAVIEQLRMRELELSRYQHPSSPSNG